uniref:AP complex mu/sigma subunit domain-containing protein n=1 Tax=Cannabis sativa TaxID=3483 RepID=A0A803NHR1_CANSA
MRIFVRVLSCRGVTGTQRVILTRGPKLCNFVEWRGYKVVYKRYASLYFCMCIDQDDNELEVLEIIHHYVEILDRYFGSVCELDLIFNFHKDSLVETAKEASSISNIIAKPPIEGRCVVILVKRTSTCEHLSPFVLQSPPPLETPITLIEKDLNAKDVSWDDDGVLDNPMDLEMF